MRTAGVVDGDVGEHAVGDALLRAGVVLGPDLHGDFHRGVADAVEARVAGDGVADLDGGDEAHGVDRDRDDAAAGVRAGEDGAAEVHLRDEPAAEEVAVGVGVGGHRDRADHDFALRLGGGGRVHARSKHDASGGASLPREIFRGWNPGGRASLEKGGDALGGFGGSAGGDVRLEGAFEIGDRGGGPEVGEEALGAGDRAGRAAQGGGGEGGDGGVERGGVEHDAVEQADGVGFFGVEDLAEQEEFTDVPLAELTAKERHDHGREQAAVNLGEAEFRVGGRNSEVAGAHETRAAGEGGTVDGGDGDKARRGERAESAGDVFGGVVGASGVEGFGEVESGAKHGAGAAEDEHATGGIGLGDGESGPEFLEQGGAEGVALVGAIEREGSDRALRGSGDQ